MGSDPVGIAEQIIAAARASRRPGLRSYVLGVLRSLYDAERIDDEDFLRRSANVANWIADAGSMGVVRRVLWPLGARVIR